MFFSLRSFSVLYTCLDGLMAATVAPDSTVLADEVALADVGELAGPLTHEVNNLLNNLTLHLAVMQQLGSASLTPDLEAIRRQITQFAAIVARFQRRRRQNDRGEPDIVNLNAMVSEAAHLLPPGTVSLELDSDLAGVRGFPNDLRRLCRFLLANAVRATTASDPVLARTQQTTEGVQLIVEDAGPDIPAELLLRIFDPGNECREGMCCLELAACRTLMRRLRGTLRASPRPERGLIIAATLPPAT
jgi:signal transduction histidine kinase